ncbi:MAG: arginine--tRNA ligase [bacterium]|nr:arginine--tRNA ligase [bacterium]
MTEAIKNQIQGAIKEKIGIEVVASEKEDFGHYSTNVAFKLVPIFKKAPLEIAKELTQKLSGNKMFVKIEAVAPGFVNFWLAPEFLQSELQQILKQGKSFGEFNAKPSQKINIEFVSANPTGPLTMANGRGGFYGDALCNVLKKAGHDVTREYYINDAGNQTKLLGESILAELGIIARQENHYKGDYIKKYAESILKKREAAKKYGFRIAVIGGITVDLDKNKILEVENFETIGKIAQTNKFDPVKKFTEDIKESLKTAGIKFDKWFSEEQKLHKTGEVKKVLEFLKKKDLVKEREGALWLVPSKAEGLEDVVLIKSDGNPTYFMVDLAYHLNKLSKRKFDLAIDIWGADHHGAVARLQNGIKLLGMEPRKLKIILMQLVRLISGGKEVKMSKRAGEFVTMDELLKEVGADVARFFFLMHSPDTHMDFDLDLAKERSQKNPVYYTQYAYVRAINILRRANPKSEIRNPKLNLLAAESEIKLMLELLKWPDVLAECAQDYQVQRLTKYAMELARAWHNFYEKERVVGVEDDLMQARLALVKATKIIFEDLFGVLGVSKPKKM